ncbi:hypothetical protein E3N88_09921 [Mikania micrantha]|uniref:Uncharacterized protein n=1 Tax=Mikania micrantha TaxID=192012 RepID=A0A5N6P964_9ASTR|nr:hypothetical protein E3N88_09921 [Mikania micrantha]
MKVLVGETGEMVVVVNTDNIVVLVKTEGMKVVAVGFAAQHHHRLAIVIESTRHKEGQKKTPQKRGPFKQDAWSYKLRDAGQAAELEVLFGSQWDPLGQEVVASMGIMGRF